MTHLTRYKRLMLENITFNTWFVVRTSKKHVQLCQKNIEGNTLPAIAVMKGHIVPFEKYAVQVVCPKITQYSGIVNSSTLAWELVLKLV